MHMVQDRGVAVRTEVPSSEIFDRITRFLDVRVAALTAAGIDPEQAGTFSQQLWQFG